MRKNIISIMMIGILLSGGFMTTISANSTDKEVSVSYTANPKLSINGPNEVIKGTQNNIYEGLIDGNLGDFIWSVEGATSKDTHIDNNGNLIVGVDETSDKINIVIESKVNPNNVVRKEVTLVDKTYTVVSVEKKADITMPYGTTEQQLEEQLDKNHTFKVIIKTNDNKTYEIEVSNGVYYSNEDVIDADGKVKEGRFEVFYDLVLPYLTINYDDTIMLDTKVESNVIGNASTSIMVTIEKSGAVVDPMVPEKPVTGTTHPNTGDSTNVMMYVGIAGLASLLLLISYKRRKQEEV